MLSYQHGYHAGNPADVHKHYVVLAVSAYLNKKPAPVHYFDTHGGKGLYQLDDPQSQKKQEYKEGIEQAMRLQSQLQDDIWKLYFATVESVNPSTDKLSYYPGSPVFVAQQCRHDDRHTVFELHPAEHEALAAQQSQQVGRVVYGDGLKGVVAALPPKTPRLMVLIDPAYERGEEYTDVAETVQRILQKCRHAVILIWYPLIPKDKHLVMLDALKSYVSAPTWQSEWHYKERPENFGMYGSGMLIVNPPWQINSQIEQGFEPWTAAGVGKHLGQWVVQE